MLIFQPSVNFCSDENIQTIFGTKLDDFLNYRIVSIQFNSISQTVEKIGKKIFFSAPKAPKIRDRQVLVEPTLAAARRTIISAPYIKSIQKSKNHQRRIFLDNYYRQRCLV
jgi:hypothetical protein